MINYKPRLAASSEAKKMAARLAAARHLNPNFDRIAYAAALEVLG